MASFTFKWPHAASEVYVTGTFDNWAKTEKLEKTATGFEKHVQLPKVEDKIMYKFVVDGNWTTDHLAPSETDHNGNVNNILTPEHLSVANAAISSVAPSSTTAALAGQVPHEKPAEKDDGATSGLPGQFPITPAAELSVNPIPATSGAGNPVKLAPGEKVPEPSSYTSDTLTSNVRLDQESYERGTSAHESLPTSQVETYSVKPLPATAGAGNPIHLAPGEKVPNSSSYTAGTLGSNVKLDKDSYEKSGSSVPQLPPVLDSQEQSEAQGASIFGLPPVGGTFIPESSLPMGAQATTLGNPSISSVGPQSTTAHLAGQQLILPRGVPEVVKDSQHTAHASPEAASSKQAVQDKSLVEEELKDTIPVVPAISSAAPQSTTAELAGQQPIQPRDIVPDVVTESQTAAHVPPEAASSKQAVQDKSFVEEELLDRVPEAPSTSESGVLGKSEKGWVAAAVEGLAAAGTAAATAAYAARDQLADATGERDSAIPSPPAAPTAPAAQSAAVPDIVSESQQAAHTAPEATSSPQAVQDKSHVEDELKDKVPVAPATSESGLMGNSEKGITGAAAGGVAAAGAAVAGAGAAVAGAAYAARDKVVEATGQPSGNLLPVSVQDTIPQVNGVPDVVTESQQRAHAAPEASANPEAVKEKAAVEQELERKVSPSEASGAPAPTASAALSSTAPVKTTAQSTPGLSVSVPTTTSAPVNPVVESIPAADSTKASSLAAPEPTSKSRDVSPMTKTSDTHSTTPPTTATPSTPQKTVPGTVFKNTLNTPDSTSKTATSGADSPAESKKSKRRSFFGRIKDKLKG